MKTAISPKGFVRCGDFIVPSIAFWAEAKTLWVQSNTSSSVSEYTNVDKDLAAQFFNAERDADFSQLLVNWYVGFRKATHIEFAEFFAMVELNLIKETPVSINWAAVTAHADQMTIGGVT